MTDLSLVSGEHLAMQAAAFKAARGSLAAGRESALDSLRRLATAVQRLADRRGLAELGAVAARVVAASREALPSRAAELEDVLDALVSGVDLSTFQILIVEDDAAVRELLGTVLESPHHALRFAPTLEEARRFLAEEPASLIVLDLALPDGDGRDLLVQLRDQAGGQGLQVIVLSGLSDPQVKAECFALGADEYVEKPIQPAVFRAVIESRLKRTLAMRQESQLDQLTQLPTRAAFGATFERVVAAARQEGAAVCLAILDVDRFKSVNDTFGHAAGDEVLRRLARLLRDHSRSSDHSARWGGEEFVVLYRGISRDQARDALERVLSEFRVQRFREKGLEVSFSAGIVDVAAGAGLADSLTAADARLYLAKQGGRDRIVADESDPDTKAAPISG